MALNVTDTNPEQKPLTVLNVNKFYRHYGGSEVYFFGLARMLEAHGHRVVPFAMHHPENFQTPYSRFFVNHVDYDRDGFLKQIGHFFRQFYAPRDNRKIRALIRETGAEIAHLHLFSQQLSASLLRAIKAEGLPIVYTIHEPKVICPNHSLFRNGHICEKCVGRGYYHCALHRCAKGRILGSICLALEAYYYRLFRLYRYVDRFIAPSRYFKELMVSSGFAASKIATVPNFVDTTRIRPCFENDGYVLYFGRLSPEKGLETLVRAMAQLSSAKLVLAGVGPMTDRLKEEIARLGLDARVELRGFLTGENLAQTISRSLFTVLATEGSENSPFTALESFAYGKAVVASRIAGIPELIADGCNGLLFNPGSVDDLAVKMETLFRAPDLARRMGVNARQLAEERFSEEKHFAEIAGIYRELL